MTATPSTAAMLEALLPCRDPGMVRGCYTFLHRGDVGAVHAPECAAAHRPAVASALDAKERLIADKDAEIVRLRSALEQIASLSNDSFMIALNFEELYRMAQIKAKAALQTTEQTEKT